jgi:hypothetical protein
MLNTSFHLAWEEVLASIILLIPVTVAMDTNTTKNKRSILWKA